MNTKTIHFERDTFELEEWKEIIDDLNSDPSITCLRVFYCELDDSVAEIIAEARHLTKINLSHNNITAIGANKLIELPLTELILIGNPIDTPIENLVSSKIPKLNFCACHHIGRKNLRYLFENPNIIELYLSEVCIKDKDLQYLKNNITLKKLEISNCGAITFNGMEYIANTSIETLDLSDNLYIGNIGIKNLSSNKSLLSLSISQMGITDVCINDLIKIPKLSHVDATLNNFSFHGISILKGHFKHVSVSSTNGHYMCSFIDSLSLVKSARSVYSDN